MDKPLQALGNSFATNTAKSSTASSQPISVHRKIIQKQMGMNGGATPTRPELPKQAYKPKVKMGAVSIATAPDLMVGTKMRNMPASFAAGMVSKAKPGAPALASGGIMGLAGSIASKVSPAPAGGSKARSEILRNKLKDFNKK